MTRALGFLGFVLGLVCGGIGAQLVLGREGARVVQPVSEPCPQCPLCSELQPPEPDSFSSSDEAPNPEGPWECPDGMLNASYWLKKSGSDKYSRHKYHRYYERWLQEVRCKPGLKICEIGADRGKSLKAWENYFPHAKTILGLAYGNDAGGVEKKVGEKSTILWGDQFTNKTMDEVYNQGPWDVIIDDGSHLPPHMAYSLFYLWKSVNPGGMYIIEDLETNYWRHGKVIFAYRTTRTGIDATPQYSMVKKLDQIRESLMRWQIGAGPNLTIMPGDEDLCSMEWGMNIMRLRKCTSWEMQNMPPVERYPSFDVQAMQKWLDDARSTNPQM